MNNSNIIYKTKSTTANELFLHLEKCNNYFIPHLEETVNILEYSKKLSEKAITFEAWDNNILIGLVAAYFNDFNNNIGYISNVSLDKDYYGLGIASNLIEMSVNYAKLHYFNEIKLKVNKFNSSALHLYKKFGFVVIGKNSEYVMMNLKLNSN